MHTNTGAQCTRTSTFKKLVASTVEIAESVNVYQDHIISMFTFICIYNGVFFSLLRCFSFFSFFLVFSCQHLWMLNIGISWRASMRGLMPCDCSTICMFRCVCMLCVCVCSVSLFVYLTLIFRFLFAITLVLVCISISIVTNTFWIWYIFFRAHFHFHVNTQRLNEWMDEWTKEWKRTIQHWRCEW